MSEIWSNYWWVAAFALLAFIALWRSRQARRDLRNLPSAEPASGPAPATAGAVDAQLVAVIAAAVAAASGLSTSQFRVTHIQATGNSTAFTTPPWGHADRFAWSQNSR